MKRMEPHGPCVIFLSCRRSKPLLYRICTAKDLPMVASRLPERVFTELARGIYILDSEYGSNRDPHDSGGYSLLIEDSDDLVQLKEIVDYDVHPAEWVTAIGRNTGYLSALYLLNDDYSIMAYIPVEIAPAAILIDLEV